MKIGTITMVTKGGFGKSTDKIITSTDIKGLKKMAKRLNKRYEECMGFTSRKFKLKVFDTTDINTSCGGNEFKKACRKIEFATE